MRSQQVEHLSAALTCWWSALSWTISSLMTPADLLASAMSSFKCWMCSLYCWRETQIASLKWSIVTKLSGKKGRISSIFNNWALLQKLHCLFYVILLLEPELSSKLLTQRFPSLIPISRVRSQLCVQCEGQLHSLLMLAQHCVQVDSFPH